MCQAYLRKYYYETRIQTTSIPQVEQVDDDTVVIYRRQETIATPVPAYERITINRKDMTMKAESLMPNTDGTTGVMDRHIFFPVGQKSKEDFEVYATVGKHFSVESFKAHIAKCVKAIKFAQFDQE